MQREFFGFQQLSRFSFYKAEVMGVGSRALVWTELPGCHFYLWEDWLSLACLGETGISCCFFKLGRIMSSRTEESCQNTVFTRLS